jgi:hypothetical protein
MKCSCGWKAKPGARLKQDSHRNLHCPNCDAILQLPKMEKISIEKMLCPMCRFVSEFNNKIPESLKKKIRSKKGRFYGKLIKAVMKAGGAPGWFRPENMKYITMEGLLNSLTSNNIEFKIFFKGEEQ